MSAVDNALAAMTPAITEINAFLAEAHDILTGSHNEEQYNPDPEITKDAISTEISTYDQIIAKCNALLDVTGQWQNAARDLLGLGYPAQPVIKVFASVLADLIADRDRINKAIAHMEALPEATGGEIQQSDVP